MGRILAIGDIHGCAAALDRVLTAVDLRPDDTIVTLGDYVGRGPDTRGVLERLLALSKTHHLVALRGNHEEMMLQARHKSNEQRLEWLWAGGDAVLDSYGGALENVPKAHWDFLETRCVPYWESDTHFFVHANADPDLPLADQSEYEWYWLRFGRTHPAGPHESGKIMVCGHTSQKNGLPVNRGFAVCLDTWAVGDGWLSCLDVGSGRIWQAKQDTDETRQLWLDDLL